MCIRDRANAVQQLLGDERTSFLIVSTSETVPLREAEFFAEELAKRNLDIGAVVMNKVLPTSLSNPAVNDLAQEFIDQREVISDHLSHLLKTDGARLRRVLTIISESFDDFAVVARREALSRDRFSRGDAALIPIPFFDHDIHDMAGLLELGHSMMGRKN